MHQTDPVISLAILLAAALVGGMIAHRLRQPVILGYLAIGVAVGPYALGVVDDVALIEATATIGVALLMFTLGLEISITQLREVGKGGTWGGIAQIMVTFALGVVVGSTLFRWPVPQSILFGLIISLSSTAVCLKLLMERGELTSVHGRLMIAILIVQDIAVVLMMVVTPLLGGAAQNIPLALAVAAGKAALFIGIAIVSGLWLLPWLMGRVGGVRSRELFLLTILVLCLGAAVGTQVFGLSMVFGAFLIGLVLRGTRFGYQAVAEITPLRDIFATLFFVSLGMLLDPKFVLDQWSLVLLTVAIVISIKMLIVFSIIRLFGHTNRIAIMSGAGLFQIGEFGFIVAQGGLVAGIITQHFYSLILSTAIITMLLTPLFLSLVARFYPHMAPARVIKGFYTKEAAASLVSESPPSTERVVIAGYGRIGQNVAQGLQDAGVPFIVIEIDSQRIAELRHSGKPRIYGDASNARVLSQAGLNRAKTLVVTFPDPLAVINTVRVALEINHDLNIVARVHRTREADLLKGMGVTELISPEYEASLEFLKRTLTVSGWKRTDIKQTLPIVQQDRDFVEFSPDEEA
ncbi:MAG TPA: cation:proton antiporter [Dehalococcoidales bacterium]|nr:cation:proton antiporter [Dehalococcoidales bacterium]